MRILLVYPKDIAGAYTPRRPPLGLGYLGTVLQREGHSVVLLDMRIKKYDTDYFKQVLKRFKPNIVGFSLLSMSITIVDDLAKIVKDHTPAKVIGGGPEATLLGNRILSDLKHFDYLLLGEAEYSIVELVNCIIKGKDVSKVNGMLFNKNDKLYQKEPEVIKDLDKLPFPKWELFDLSNYKRNISKIKMPIMTSRGCPYCCKFCESTKINKIYRTRSPKNVVDEMEYNHKRFGITNYQIMDDNFAIYKDRVMGICDEIINRKLKIKWIVGQGFSVGKADYELFKRMKEAGCVTIFFGIESADDEILREIRKPHTVALVEKAIKDAKRAGLIVKGNFISGLPKSTFQKELKYIEFFKRTRIDVPKMGHLMPFPNTEIYNYVKNETRPAMDIDELHRLMSGGRGTENTKYFGIPFETEEYSFEERRKLVDLFLRESEKYIIQNIFGKFLGTLIFWISRIRLIRSFGIKILDRFSDNY